MPWLITLYVVAGLLEGLGIGFVFVDLRDVRNRLQSYMSSPRIVNLRPAQETETALPLTIRHDPPPPVETRVQNLEDAFQQHRAQHSEDVAKLKDYARTETGEAIDYVQKSVGNELTRLVNLVFALNDPDKPGLRRWWHGPVLLASGLVLGVIGNVISASVTS
jgi:hypothetical protein